MALNPGVIYAALAANRASGGFPMAGVNFDRMALGVANGVCQWGIGQPQNLGLVGVAAGSAGAGIINPATTKIIVPPNVGVVSAAIAGAGMVGPLGQCLAVVIAMGISQAFSTAGQYSGASTGVGLGADVSKITVVNAGTLIPMLMQSLAATLGPGPAMTMMAAGVGNGIAGLLLLGTGTGSVNGPPSPSPGSGPTLSVVV